MAPSSKESHVILHRQRFRSCTGSSKLARYGRDWHTLLEFCCLVGTLIVDEDGVDDRTAPNDRLLFGMKGTMREIELSVFR